MGFGNYLANGFKAIALDDKAILANAKDRSVVKNGVILVSILSFLCGLAGMAAMLSLNYDLISIRPGLGFGLGFLLGVLIAWILSFLPFISHLLATLFGGKGVFLRYWSTVASISFALLVVQILFSLLPLIGFLASIAVAILSVVIGARVVRVLYGLTTLKAFFVSVIGTILFYSFIHGFDNIIVPLVKSF